MYRIKESEKMQARVFLFDGDLRDRPPGDPLVYGLYGLTAGEIAVVEEAIVK